MFDLARHRDAIRRACVVSLAALGLVAASCLAGALGEAQAVTDQQCTDAVSTDLLNECEFDTLSGGTTGCYFEAYCPTGSGNTDNFTTISVGLDDVPDMVNCSGNLATSC